MCAWSNNQQLQVMETFWSKQPPTTPFTFVSIGHRTEFSFSKLSHNFLSHFFRKQGDEFIQFVYHWLTPFSGAFCTISNGSSFNFNSMTTLVFMSNKTSVINQSIYKSTTFLKIFWIQTTWNLYRKFIP